MLCAEVFSLYCAAFRAPRPNFARFMCIPLLWRAEQTTRMPRHIGVYGGPARIFRATPLLKRYVAALAPPDDPALRRDRRGQHLCLPSRLASRHHGPCVQRRDQTLRLCYARSLRPVSKYDMIEINLSA